MYAFHAPFNYATGLMKLIRCSKRTAYDYYTCLLYIINPLNKLFEFMKNALAYARVSTKDIKIERLRISIDEHFLK